MTTHLQINSNNPDLNGNWFKADVEEEIEELLERKPESDTEWIEWIFNHVFDFEEFEDMSVLDMIAKHDWITEISLESKNYDKITITKR